MSKVFAFLCQKANCRQNRCNVKWQCIWSFYTSSASPNRLRLSPLEGLHTHCSSNLGILSDGSLQPVALGVSHPVYRLWLGIPSHHPAPLVLSFNPLCAFQDLDFCSVLLTCPLLPAKTFCLTSVISLMEEESSVLYNTPQVLEQDLTRYKDSVTICQINNFQVQW